MMDKNRFEYKVKGDQVRITRVDPALEVVVIPERVEGLSVTEIGDYAFRESSLVDLKLPGTVRRIGRYAFYGCEKLESLTLSDNIKDIGAGAFTGVHKVRCLYVTMTDTDRSVLQELLLEFTEDLDVWLYRENQEGHLFFPLFYEDSRENTPARLLELRTWGTGLKYRNSFRNRQLHMETFDKVFPHAVAEESEETIFRISYARLLSPIGLSEEARVQYEDYWKAHALSLLKWMIKNRDDAGIAYVTEHHLAEDAAMGAAARYAAAMGYPRGVSRLMDSGRPAGEKQSKFDLDEI